MKVRHIALSLALLCMLGGAPSADTAQIDRLDPAGSAGESNERPGSARTSRRLILGDVVDRSTDVWRRLGGDIRAFAYNAPVSSAVWTLSRIAHGSGQGARAYLALSAALDRARKGTEELAGRSLKTVGAAKVAMVDATRDAMHRGLGRGRILVVRTARGITAWTAKALWGASRGVLRIQRYALGFVKGATGLVSAAGFPLSPGSTHVRPDEEFPQTPVAADDVVTITVAPTGRAGSIEEVPATIVSPLDAAPPVSVAFARPRTRVKTQEELRIEGIIQDAFQAYVREYTIDGRSFIVRMPFGLNGERAGSSRYSQVFFMGAKGTPEQLWTHVDSVFASARFRDYARALDRPEEKVVILDLERKSFSISHDPALVEAMTAGEYPGTPTRIFVHKRAGGLTEADIYNYLYAVASVGVDCSGFLYTIHKEIAEQYGVDLDRLLAGKLGIRPEFVSRWIGTWFYDPGGGHTQKIEDNIEDLRPGDVILFRGSDGSLKHSAMIQSIDFDESLVRYVQSTDWAIEPDRGVHRSTIRFDPFRPRATLDHYSVRWTQRVSPPFRGELEPRDWLTDGDRYLWYTDAGGSLVVRFSGLAELIRKQEPRFYANIFK
jgi:hypothetical protein